MLKKFWKKYFKRELEWLCAMQKEDKVIKCCMIVLSLSDRLAFLWR